MKKFITYILIICFVFESGLRVYAASSSADYSKPVLQNSKFIYTKQNNKTLIQHKFLFGDTSSQVDYVLQSPFAETFNMEANNGTPLGSTYAGKRFELFVPGTNARRTETGGNYPFLLTFPQSDGDYLIAGIFAGSIPSNGKCNATYSWQGHNFQNAAPVGIGQAQDQRICLFSLTEYDTNNTKQNALINDNYYAYVHSLISYLQNSSVTTTMGSGSINMTPPNQKLSECKNDALKGTFNTKYPEMIQTFINALVAQVQADKQQSVKDLLTSDKIKVSNEEDLNLFKDFYATDSSLGYANKYIDKTLQNKFADLLNRVSSDQVYYDVYSNKTWFESSLASVAGTIGIKGTELTAAAAGATYAYSIGSQVTVAWLTGAQAVESSTFLTGVLVNLLGSGQAAAGIAAGIASVGLIAAIGALLIGSVIYLYQRAKAHYTEEFFHSSLLFLYASAYISANYKNQSCTGKIEQFPEQQKVYNNMMSVSNSTLDSIQKSIANGTNDGLCPEAHFTDPVSWFKSSVCGLGIALNELSNKFFLFAEQQLLTVLGLAYKNGY